MASESVLLPDQLTAVQPVEETSLNVPITKSQERTEDNKIHQPATEKVDDSPELAVPAEESALVTEDANSKPVVSSVSELAVADVGKETEGQTGISDASKSAVKSVERPLHSPPTQEPGAEVATKLEELLEQESKVVEKTESVAEEPQFGKEPEEPYKEVENPFPIVEESEIGKNLKVAELDSKVVEKPESVVEAEVEPQKQSENVEATEEKHEKFEPEEIIEGKLAADEGVLISKDNDAIESTTKTETGEDQEPFADKSSDAFVSKTPSDPIDKDVSNIPAASAEDPQDKAQQEDIWSDTVENFSKGASLEVNRAEEEKNAKDENLAKPETTTAEDVGDAHPATEVLEKSYDGLVSSGNVEIDTEEEKKETVKDDTVAPVKTVKDTEPIASKPEEGGEITSVTEVAEKSFEAFNTFENFEAVTEEKKEENVESNTAPLEITNDIVPQSSEDKEVDYSNFAAEVAEKKDENVEVAVEKDDNVKDDTADAVETIDDKEPMTSKTDEGVVDTTSSTEVTEKFVDELKASKDVEVTEEKVEDVKSNNALAEITKDTVPQSSEPKEVYYSNSAAEVVEKSIEGQKASTDDVATEEKKQENVKDYTTTSVHSSKDTDLEGETNVSSTIDTPSKTDKGFVDSTSATEVTEKFVDGLKASKDVEVTEEKAEDVKSSNALAQITKDTLPQSSEPKEVDYSNSAAEVVEKSFEGQKASTDDLATEEKKQENVKDYTTASVDSAKDTVLEEVTNVSSTIDTSSGAPRELVLEPRENYVAERKEDKKITKEDEVAETTPSSDALNLESSTETNDSKTAEDQSKQEVPTKPVQKHSHGILSKVKHSIVKVKKAITGKSPTSKNSTSDAKGDDVKVKEGTN